MKRTPKLGSTPWPKGAGSAANWTWRTDPRPPSPARAGEGGLGSVCCREKHVSFKEKRVSFKEKHVSFMEKRVSFREKHVSFKENVFPASCGRRNMFARGPNELCWSEHVCSGPEPRVVALRLLRFTKFVYAWKLKFCGGVPPVSIEINLASLISLRTPAPPIKF